MKRKMNKENRQMNEARLNEVIKNANHGILSVNGDDGFPYAVPVNYVYEDGKIYIHSAKYGYKIDAIRENNKVCFTIIISSKVIPEKFTAAYQSIISSVTDETKRRHILEQYIYNMAPNNIENGMKFVDACIKRTELLQIDITEITGKESFAKELDTK